MARRLGQLPARLRLQQRIVSALEVKYPEQKFSAVTQTQILGTIGRILGLLTLVLAGAIGFVLAIGHYDVNAYLWLEGAFVFGTIILIILFFSKSARPLLAKLRPERG